MSVHRAEHYRRKANECRLHAAGAKHLEVEASWQKLAAEWERLARELDAGEHAKETNPTPVLVGT
jgi:hypothetical protein